MTLERCRRHLIRRLWRTGRHHTLQLSSVLISWSLPVEWWLRLRSICVMAVGAARVVVVCCGGGVGASREELAFVAVLVVTLTKLLFLHA